MIAVVWAAAIAGMAIKLFLPGRFDRLAIVFYLAIGWSGMVVIRPMLDSLPPLTLGLILAGGIAYSAASSSSSGADCASRTRCGTALSSPEPDCIARR